MIIVVRKAYSLSPDLCHHSCFCKL